MSFKPFWPAATVSYTASDVTSGAQLLPQSSRGKMLVANVGVDVVYINFGTASVTVTNTTGMPILPGTKELFSMFNPGSTVVNPTHFAVICDSTDSSKICITAGEGDS